MENLKIKDEQIQRQAETIQSLERKVESLERELQKYLDPDSGEINPSVKYHYKTGEAALLRKIQGLETQLNDCLDLGSPLVHNDRLEQRIRNIVETAFLPVKCYNTQTKEYEKETQPWWYLRQFLFDSELLNDQWSSPEFRLGVDMLNDICQAVEATGVPGGLTRKHLSRFDFSSRMFGGSAEWAEKKIIAVERLTTSLLLVIDNYKTVESYVSKDDLYDMLAAFKILSFCQRLWTEAKEPEPAEVE